MEITTIEITFPFTIVIKAKAKLEKLNYTKNNNKISSYISYSKRKPNKVSQQLETLLLLVTFTICAGR